MTKKDAIKKIKEIIKKWGNTSSYELGLDGSPVYGTLGDWTIGLVEKFNENRVLVVIYNRDVEIDDFHVDYEDLDKNLFLEILCIMEDYDTEETKTFKRCEN